MVDNIRISRRIDAFQRKLDEVRQTSPEAQAAAAKAAKKAERRRAYNAPAVNPFDGLQSEKGREFDKAQVYVAYQASMRRGFVVNDIIRLGASAATPEKAYEKLREIGIRVDPPEKYVDVYTYFNNFTRRGQGEEQSQQMPLGQ